MPRGIDDLDPRVGQSSRVRGRYDRVLRPPDDLDGKIEPGQTSLPPLGQPGHIKEECDKSLRRLRLDHLDLYQVNVPDPGVPYEDTVGAFAVLQRAGKVRHIVVSNVTLEQLAVARSLCTVVSVQNAYNVGTRTSENLLAACEEAGMAFRDVLARDIRDVRQIVGTKYDDGLRQLLRYHRESFPELMAR